MEYSNIRKAKPGGRIKNIILGGLVTLALAGSMYIVKQNDKKRQMEYESKLKNYNQIVEYKAVSGDTYCGLAARYGPRDVPIKMKYKYLMELNKTTSPLIGIDENLKMPSGNSWKNLEDKVKKIK